MIRLFCRYSKYSAWIVSNFSGKLGYFSLSHMAIVQSYSESLAYCDHYPCYIQLTLISKCHVVLWDAVHWIGLCCGIYLHQDTCQIHLKFCRYFHGWSCVIDSCQLHDEGCKVGCVSEILIVLKNISAFELFLSNEMAHVVWILPQGRQRPAYLTQLTGNSLGMHAANERCCYNATTSLIDWAHT